MKLKIIRIPAGRLPQTDRHILVVAYVTDTPVAIRKIVHL